jgi:uncharacterized protein YggE
MLGALAAVVVLVGVLLVRGQPRTEPASELKGQERKITTSGTATVRVKPDSARIFFGVETMASTIKQARAESSERVKKVRDALNALRMPDLKMKTSTVSVELVQKRQEADKLPEVAGYRITNSFTVLVTNDDPQKLGPAAGRILDTALEAGANQVQQIAIFRQDTTEAKRQALAKAVEEARANAAALAEGAKARIKDTIDINGQPQYYVAARQLTNTAQVQAPNEGGEETPVMAGEVEVTCQVFVTCTY